MSATIWWLCAAFVGSSGLFGYMLWREVVQYPARIQDLAVYLFGYGILFSATAWFVLLVLVQE